MSTPRPLPFTTYIPLMLHLIPTLGIGYFIVIPQSCIAGVNELTIGFAAANIGFVLSYLAGLRLARKHGGAPCVGRASLPNRRATQRARLEG